MFVFGLLVLVIYVNRNNWTSSSIDFADHCIETELRIEMVRQFLSGQLHLSDLPRALWNVSFLVLDPFGTGNETINQLRVQTTLYPLNSLVHWLAAPIVAASNSCLRGFNILTVTTIWNVYFLWMLIVALAARSLTAGMAFGLVAVTANYCAFQIIGHEIVANFFLPQLFAELIFAIALLTMVALARRPLPLFISAHIILLVCVSAHLLPGLRAFGVFSLYFAFIFCRSARSWRDFLLFCAAALSLLINVCVNPVTWALVRAADYEGGLVVSLGSYFPLFCGTTALVTGFWLARSLWRPRPFVEWAVVAAVFSAAALAILQIGIFQIAGKGSRYAINKHAFGLFTLVLALVVSQGWQLASFSLRRFGIRLRTTNSHHVFHVFKPELRLVLFALGATVVTILFLHQHSMPLVGSRVISAERVYNELRIGRQFVRDGGVQSLEEGLPVVVTYLFDYWQLGNDRPTALRRAFGDPSESGQAAGRFGIIGAVRIPENCIADHLSKRLMIYQSCAAQYGDGYKIRH